jgi:uncharacterized membrane protein YqjE
MVYAAAILFLTLFYLLLKMRSAWLQHEDRQDARLKKLEEELTNTRERLQNLEAIEADLGPFENLRNRSSEQT